MNRIVLGTAQFGLDYGINNSRGKVPADEVVNILDEAYKAGVNMLDTAAAYGQSESIIGRYLQMNIDKFLIVSKLPQCTAGEVGEHIERSLTSLNVMSLYGYLIHDFNSYKDDPRIWDVVKDYQAKGKITKVGFSLYNPAELDLILEQGLAVDLVQVPYSVFDQRFSEYFKLLRAKGIEIHVRSVFLQGLVFKEPQTLTGQFKAINGKLARLNDLARGMNVDVTALCLGFVLANELIDLSIVGVDSLDNFMSIIEAAGQINKVKAVREELSSLSESDENIILPTNWQLDRVGAN